jgi:hypothetical protein
MRNFIFIIFAVFLTGLFACQSVRTSDKRSARESFIGQQIPLAEVYSPQLKSIDINVTFPEGFRVLDSAQPYVKLMTADGKLINDYLVDKFPLNITLKKEIHSSQLFVDLSIYYCRETGLAMCLRKNVLYEVKLDEASERKTLSLNYQVKDEGN